MLSTDLSVLEIEALVGPMEPIPCEHIAHDTQGFGHGGNAEYYVKGFHLGCGYDGPMKAVCKPYADWMISNLPARCTKCQEESTGLEVLKIVGRIDGTIQ
jgi:hypothetical protein